MLRFWSTLTMYAKKCYAESHFETLKLSSDLFVTQFLPIEFVCYYFGSRE